MREKGRRTKRITINAYIFIQFKMDNIYIAHLRGSTPFQDMIFYLWTDSYEIFTAYVKLKINDTFIHEKILIFALVFEKITILMFLRGIFKIFFKKNRSQKPSMQEQKQ